MYVGRGAPSDRPIRQDVRQSFREICQDSRLHVNTYIQQNQYLFMPYYVTGQHFNGFLCRVIPEARRDTIGISNFGTRLNYPPEK